MDGALRTLGTNELDFGSDGRVAPSVGGGIEINFPDGTTLVATPGWWASQNLWYLNLSVFHTPASQGIMGAIAPGSWLPALPNGASMGQKPTDAHQRYVDLYQKFADAWRVSGKTSLFDYAPGTSTETFTLRNWPQENGPCVIPENPPVTQIETQVAKQVCRAIGDKSANANCIFDVATTGETVFAKTYLLSQEIRKGSATITVTTDKTRTRVGESVTFIANVEGNALGGRTAPSGLVRFTLDGEVVGEPVKLNSNGRASWKTSNLKVGDHRLTARYIPSKDSEFLTSTIGQKTHTVTGKREVSVKDASRARPRLMDVVPRVVPR